MSGVKLSNKTFGNQDLLPKLPVPELADTCERFLEWVRPILSPEELEQTQGIVQTFLAEGGEGQKLHQALLKWSKGGDIKSWLEGFWYDSYLQVRDCIAVNSNFALVFDESSAFKGMNQLQRATAVTRKAIEFKDLIEKEELAPDVAKGTPICMKQMRQLYSACRIPKQDQDILVNAYPDDNSKPEYARHIVVFYKGNIFSLQVCDEQGQALSDSLLLRGFEKILTMGEEAAKEDETVGLLTTMNRDQWATTREALIQVKSRNKQLLEKIEKSLFSISLDEDTPTNLTEATQSGMHADGTNRWFDKPFQLIIGKGGWMSINGEHSGFDGHTVNRLLDSFHEPTTLDLQELTSEEQPTVESLNFALNDEIRGTIRQAKTDFTQFVGGMKTKVLRFDHFGTDKIKSLKISPDGFIQAAMQVAQYRIFKECRNTYESVMVKHFLHGRTECHRSVTTESVDFVQKFFSTESTIEEKVEALRKSSQKHGDRLRQCQKGEGVERHFFGLYQMFTHFGKDLDIKEVPAIFNSPGWKKLRHDVFSTSSIGNSSALNVGFGPMTTDGFGVGYMTRPGFMTFTITAKAHMEKQWKWYIENLEACLLQLEELLIRG